MGIATRKNSNLSDKEHALLVSHKIPYYNDTVIADYLLYIDTTEAKRKNYHPNYQRYLHQHGLPL